MALEAGAVLGGRFAIVGVLGNGGSATVYLAVDQLRGEKVALKVVHSHLAGDPRVRRRIQREVRAATVLKHEAALVPWDLHELDGELALSMPYHAGRTLRERVSAEGPLPIDAVRTLGSRIAGALADAHRSGLLHLDVSPNNVLVEGGQAPMLMDFGLSHAQTDATRSVVVGTTGYMAPEQMGGGRAQPAVDLYGLGCALYFSITGVAPFPTENPMAALQAQMSSSFTPIPDLRPDCPPDLVQTVHALLSAEPSERPASAGAVRDAIEDAVAPALTTPSTQSTGRTAHLEPGNHAVVVAERDEDRARRKQLRIDAKKAPNTVEATVAKRARDIMSGVLAYVGIEKGEEEAPERLLVRAVADEAEVDAAALSQPVVMVQKEFILADRVSASAANRIASDARSAGFRAHALEHRDSKFSDRRRLYRAALTIGWVAFGLSWVTPLRSYSFYFLFMMIAATVWINQVTARPSKDLSKLPVAYGNRLNRWLADATPGRFPLEASPAASEHVPAAEPRTRGQELVARAHGEIARLLEAIESLNLNAIASSDLRDTARALRERADELADRVDHLERELADSPPDPSWMESRLDRLHTKQRADEPVDPEEIAKLERSLAAAREAEALRGRLESQQLGAVAGLLEIGSTAASVRRNLLAHPADHAAEQAAADLKREAAALARARAELG